MPKSVIPPATIKTVVAQCGESVEVYSQIKKSYGNGAVSVTGV